MTSTIETGHIRNIANFGSLINFVKAHGQAYRPIKPSLAVDALEAKKTEVQTIVNEVQAAKARFDIAGNERRNAFEGLKPLATRVVNAFAVSGADALAVSSLKSANKKLQGSKPVATQAPKDQNQLPGKISVSQQSYDQQTAHFSGMIEILRQHPAFVPNETELTVGALDQKLAGLQAVNTAVIGAYTAYNNALIRRNNSLYDPLTGLLQVAKEVKLYIKSLFGASSPQYKQVSGIEFRKIG